MSICRAYHRPIAPTYEEVLAFQKQVAIMWDSDQPSTSKQAIEIGGHNSAIQMVENEPLFTDSYDGIEEFCGESGIDSPEPGELVDGGVITFNSERKDKDEIEEGEYMEWNSDNNYHPAQSLIKANDDESDVFDRIDSSNTGESDAISLTESPLSNDHLSFPIFNDQLLESPTRIDYFGKSDKVSTLHSGYAT
ncbi:hypothetical protein DICVIV_03945 [Dictyocaulus viviparus]|uniref:Uncharacterized protein n=1 Tax=Dictyocaulus viviparus TaxID=29172 RepID=A0A0D8XZM0_DICVI|nr:hypothetical protein DICVIV_03945 [Dictyocaulus viviparus]